MNPFDHTPPIRPADKGPLRADDFERRLRQCYLRDGNTLDPATAGRLRAARRTALQAARSPAHTLQRRWLPAGAFAVLALATLAIWQPVEHHPAAPLQATVVSTPTTQEPDSDLPPDADSPEDTQLYQNLAFYDWLAATDQPRPTGR